VSRCQSVDPSFHISQKIKLHFIVNQSRAFGANRPRLGGESTTHGLGANRPNQYGANMQWVDGSGANSPERPLYLSVPKSMSLRHLARGNIFCDVS
jgi:hypothetical protein